LSLGGTPDDPAFVGEHTFILEQSYTNSDEPPLVWTKEIPVTLIVKCVLTESQMHPVVGLVAPWPSFLPLGYGTETSAVIDITPSFSGICSGNPDGHYEQTIHPPSPYLTLLDDNTLLVADDGLPIASSPLVHVFYITVASTAYVGTTTEVTKLSKAFALFVRDCTTVLDSGGVTPFETSVKLGEEKTLTLSAVPVDALCGNASIKLVTSLPQFLQWSLLNGSQGSLWLRSDSNDDIGTHTLDYSI